MNEFENQLTVEFFSDELKRKCDLMVAELEKFGLEPNHPKVAYCVKN